MEESMKHLEELEAFLEKKPGPDPYMTGLSDEEEEDKEEQMKKQAKMDDDDPDAYKELPGDEEAREEGKVKKSKHTRAYHKKFSERLKTLDEFVAKDQHDDMAYGQLESIIDNASEIRNRLESGQGLDAWMHGKVVKAKEHLTAVYDAMDGDDGVVESFIKESIDEAANKIKHSIIHNAVKKGNYPVTVIATRDGKVVRQETVDTPIAVPSVFFIIQFEERGEGGDVKVYIESRTGEILFTESADEKEQTNLRNLQTLESFVSEAVELVHVYKDGELYGTGELVKGKDKKIKGKKHQLIRFDGSTEDYYPAEDIKMVESVNEKKDQTNDQSPLGDEGMETGIKNKAKESGVPVGLLRIIMRRGLAAWKSGHRPGATQAQWGYARVNSFLTKQDGTWGGADADIAKKVRDGGHDKKL